MARYTGAGSRRAARRCACAIVPNRAPEVSPRRATSPRSGCQAMTGRTGAALRARSAPAHTPAP